MKKAGSIHAHGRKLVRDALERLHKRAEAGRILPWLPPRDGKVNPPISEGEQAKAPRMVSTIERTAKQIEEQQRKDNRCQVFDDTVSAKLREIGSRLA